MYLELVNSSVKRLRIIHDISRFLKTTVCDQAIEICCALHNFRVCLEAYQQTLYEMGSVKCMKAYKQ